MAISSCSSSLGVSLRELLQAASLDRTPVQRGRHAAEAISRCVCTAVSHFTDFLKVKAVTNFSLGSYPFNNFCFLKSLCMLYLFFFFLSYFVCHVLLLLFGRGSKYSFQFEFYLNKIFF